MDARPIGRYTAGGYLLAKVSDRPEHVLDLMPDRIISASDCIVNMTPDVWAVSWWKATDKEREQEARKFGIDPIRIPDVVSWVSEKLDSHEMGWPRVFFSVDLARRFASRFSLPTQDLALLGMGLGEECLSIFKERAKLPDDMIPHGAYEMIGKAIPLEEPGRVMGFEPLGFELGYHSWLCNGFERDAFLDFGIRPNHDGFIESYDDAKRISDYISRKEKEGEAEQGVWLPWLVVSYSLQ